MIYIFKQCTPNVDDKFYYYTSTSKFKTYLTTNFSYESITEDNYRLTSDILVIKDEGITTSALNTYTYILWEYDDQVKFYHISSYKVQSEKVFFDVQEDLFAEFISQASFSEIFVNRSTKSLSNIGRYNDIAFTNDEVFDFDTFGGSTWGDYYVVYLLSYQTPSSNIFDKSTANIILYSKMTDVHPTTQVPTTTLTINNVVENLSKVAKYKNTADTSYAHRDCKIIRAWLIPSMFLPSSVITPITKELQIFEGTTFVGTLIGYEVGYRKHIQTTFGDLDLSTYTNNFYKNEIYVGTPSHHIKLTRLLNNKIITKFTTSSSKISITINANGSIEDITDAFEINFTSNNSVSEQLESISNSLLNSLPSLAFSLAKQDYLGAGINALGTGKNIVNSAIYKPLENINLSSDALSNFMYSSSDYEGRLFCIISKPSALDESLTLQRKGITFNHFIASLDTFFNANYILASNIVALDPYIQAEVKIDNIPLEASNLIAEKFRNGMFLYKLV